MRFLAVLSICATATAWAQEAPPFAGEGREQLEERARSLQEQGKEMRKEADLRLEEETRACWKKFLVTRCMDQAKQVKYERFDEARKLEQEARNIERELRRREAAARAARWAEELPQREADAAAQAERNRQAQQEAMERVDRKREEAARRDAR